MHLEFPFKDSIECFKEINKSNIVLKNIVSIDIPQLKIVIEVNDFNIDKVLPFIKSISAIEITGNHETMISKWIAEYVNAYNACKSFIWYRDNCDGSKHSVEQINKFITNIEEMMTKEYSIW